jgi:hypothetical protein
MLVMIGTLSAVWLLGVVVLLALCRAAARGDAAQAAVARRWMTGTSRSARPQGHARWTRTRAHVSAPPVPRRPA